MSKIYYFITIIICLILSINAFGENMENKLFNNNVPYITLNNGKKMPQIGFGTWTLYGENAVLSIKNAINSGYRLIDTAQFYDNEAEVYKAIKDSGIPRSEIFITTKIAPRNMRDGRVRESLNESLKALGGDYIDLVLIHWPAEGYIKETWQIMEEYVNNGKIKSIGISNFSPNQVEELLKYAKIKPVINQIEIHPYLTQKQNIEFIFSKDIRPEAWSPLGAGDVLDDEVLKNIAKKHNKSVAQIVLRWHIQQGLIAIPRSDNKEHIIENIDIFDFELSDEEMKSIDELNKNQMVDYRNYTASFLW